jgi:hypothetical protein
VFILALRLEPLGSVASRAEVVLDEKKRLSKAALAMGSGNGYSLSLMFVGVCECWPNFGPYLWQLDGY